MTSTSDIRSAIEAATVPDSDVLERARMIIVDKLSEWGGLGLDELVESVCEAYEAPSGEPLRVADVDPAAPDTDSPALRNLTYARAARTAVIDLERDGRITSVPEQPGDGEVGVADELVGDDDDEVAIAAKETTAAAAHEAGAEELILRTGPEPQGRRFALATT